MAETLSYNKYMSEKWNHEKTLDQLIKEHNMRIDKDTCCAFMINFKKHMIDNCFDRFAIAFIEDGTKYNLRHNIYTIIGIREDGFVYVDTQYFILESNLLWIPIDQAIRIMLQYKDLMNATSNFERALNGILEQTHINIIIDNSYRLQSINNDLNFIVD